MLEIQLRRYKDSNRIRETIWKERSGTALRYRSKRWPDFGRPKDDGDTETILRFTARAVELSTSEFSLLLINFYITVVERFQQQSVVPLKGPLSGWTRHYKL
jgi:hypothetical protein